jgi:phosphoserine phosphatase RsbU/P
VLQMGSLSGPHLRFNVQQRDETVNSIPQSQVPDLLSSLHELRLLPDNVRPAAREMEKLNWLIRAARQLNEGATLGDVLGAFLHLTLQLTGLERGFVFVYEEDHMDSIWTVRPWQRIPLFLERPCKRRLKVSLSF